MGLAEQEDHLDVSVRMDLQYDGTGLHGWAKQEGLATVEGSLEEAFATVLGWAPSLCVAGRTDAGVHAHRQVVSLRLSNDVDLSKLTASLNALTPPGIAVARIVRASEGFDARNDAVRRGYRYYLSTARVLSPFWKRYCWHVGHPLDRALLQNAAAMTLGKHDFTAFTPVETEHVFFARTVEHCVWRRVATEPGLLRLEIEANAFLRHMVRTLVGTMVQVAEGKRELRSFGDLLDGAGRGDAGPTAPAHGLFLWNIGYDAGNEGREGEAIS